MCGSWHLHILRTDITNQPADSITQRDSRGESRSGCLRQAQDPSTQGQAPTWPSRFLEG